MPFKQAALPLLDELDESAHLIGAVNTIVNDAGRLKGYNTDAVGADRALKSIRAEPGDRVLVLGAGGVARAILFALRQMGFRQVMVSNRDPKKISGLGSILPCETVPWEERQNVSVDLLINATSVGMSPNVDETPVEAGFLLQTRAVMDVVVSPMESCLIKLARSMGKEVAPGYVMSLEQMIEQFRLYSGEVPPRDLIEQRLKGLLEN
jgi:shikimate dehydrogenase